MGEVFLARDPELDREVALKVLRIEAGEDPTEAIARLRDEARAVAALRHPNIVTIYEIGSDGDRAFIAMEYIDGPTLRSWIDDGAVETEKLLEIIAKVARALEAAHAAGVLHRDIKPDNVMLERGGVAKVVDFGIALRLDGKRAPAVPTTAARIDTIAATIPASSPAGATAHTIFGTPAYMAPEIIFGEPPLPTSDVYALGVTLFEALTGRLPYRADNVLDALTQAADPDIAPESLAVTRPDLDPELVALVETMLEHSASSRPTAAEVAVALESMLAPTTRVVATSRPAPRSPSRAPWIIAAAACAAALAIAAVWMSRDTADHSAVGSAKTRPIPGIAVAPVAGDYADQGHSQLKASSAGRVLAATLRTAGLDVSEPNGSGDPAERAREAGAALLVTTRLSSVEPTVRGRYALIDLASGEEVAGGELATEDIAAAFSDIARGVIAHLGLEPSDWSETNGRVNFELGLSAYEEQNWPQARLYLEQAVEAQPEFPAAWFYLAWARGWQGAPAHSSVEAARQAAATATTSLERGLGEAMERFLQRRYREAAAVIEPLLEKTPNDRDLLYTYAEALFHDGQIEAALAAFERCFKIAPRFRPAVLHLLEVAVARKSPSDVRRWRIAQGKPYAGIQAYLTGDDELAAREGMKPEQLALVNGNFGATDKRQASGDTGEALAYLMGRAAMLGTRAAARARFKSRWPEIAKAAEKPRGAFDLPILGRALVFGGYAEEVAVVRRWWREHEAPVNLSAGEELAVFAAPLTGDDLPDRAGLNTRLQRVVDAIALERAGEVERAAALFEELAAHPRGNGTDYTIWHAWARTLKASGQIATLREQCASWRRPGYFEVSIVALWAYCDEALR
jgi:tetratricopeptide (TPR) repeat protein